MISHLMPLPTRKRSGSSGTSATCLQSAGVSWSRCGSGWSSEPCGSATLERLSDREVKRDAVEPGPHRIELARKGKRNDANLPVVVERRRNDAELFGATH